MTFALHRPGSVDEAVTLASHFGPSTRFIAGGTDLIIQMNRKRLAPEHVIDLTRLRGLSRIEVGGGRCTLGALVTHKQIERHAAFRETLTALREAARVVGGHQVRNVATVGGNIANASPAADVVVPLLAFDAEVALQGPDGPRTARLADFLIGPGQTGRRFDELLTAVGFSVPPARSASAFLKAGRRKAMEISVVCVAVKLTLDAAGACRNSGVALGAVGATTIRAHAAERMLEGKTPSETLFHEAGRLAADAARPISDVRASAEYRRLLVGALVTRALNICCVRIAEGTQ